MEVLVAFRSWMKAANHVVAARCSGALDLIHTHAKILEVVLGVQPVDHQTPLFYILCRWHRTRQRIAKGRIVRKYVVAETGSYGGPFLLIERGKESGQQVVNLQRVRNRDHIHRRVTFGNGLRRRHFRFLTRYLRGRTINVEPALCEQSHIRWTALLYQFPPTRAGQDMSALATPIIRTQQELEDPLAHLPHSKIIEYRKG